MPPRPLDYLYEKLLSRAGLVLLALALIVNVGALLTMGAAAEKLDYTHGGAVDSRSPMQELLGIQALLHAAESAQRGYLYTDNEYFLKPLAENAGRVSAGLVQLRVGVADNPSQQKLIEGLGVIAQQKIAELNKAIMDRPARRQDLARSIPLLMGTPGRDLMGEFDAEIARFSMQQGQLQQGRVQQWSANLLAMRYGFAAVLLSNALMILAGVLIFVRDLSRKRAALVQLDAHAAVLASEVAQRAVELRALTAHLQSVQEEERRTIARELHDELGGTLSAVKMDIVMGRDAATKCNDEKSAARLQRAYGAIDSAIKFSRRLIENLRPTLLDNLGFEAALRSMTEQFSERSACRCIISLPAGELHLTSAQSTALYRICQEALTNVMKYAEAKKVTLTLKNDASQWTLMVADDGVGLDATKQHRSMSHGLIGMRERVVALGGSFDIRGKAGQGTTLTASFPVAKEKDAETAL